MKFEADVQSLLTKATKHAQTVGPQKVDGLAQGGAPLLQWLAHLKGSEDTGVATQLLFAVRSAIIETASSIALGLARTSTFSLRAQIDLALSWLYFKDHRIEWERVQDTGDGYKLKSEVVRYLEDHYARYKIRFGLLKQCAKRHELEPYRLLSAHVHGQSAQVTPKLEHLDDAVVPAAIDACIEMQAAVAEYMGDVFLSCFGSKWASLPDDVLKSAQARLTAAQQKDVFS